tara:strand:+ start:290 stop:493 length:204 start_codon:yes stop_codon:yes gene_type:complete
MAQRLSLGSRLRVAESCAKIAYFCFYGEFGNPLTLPAKSAKIGMTAPEKDKTHLTAQGFARSCKLIA